MYFIVSRRTITFMLGLLVIFMTLMSLAGLLAVDNAQYEAIRFFFESKYRQSPHTWIAASLLIVPALLGATIVWERRQTGAPFVAHWLGITGLMLVLSINAVSDFYGFIVGNQSDLDAAGPLLYGWFFPLFALISVLAWVYRPFFTALPAQLRSPLISAVLLLISGTIALTITNRLFLDTDLLIDRTTTTTLVADVGASAVTNYILLITLTQLVIWVGNVMIIHTLLTYLKHHTTLQIDFEPVKNTV